MKILILLWSSLALTYCTQKKPDASKVNQLIEVQAEEDLPWLKRDFSVPHFAFRHYDKGDYKYEDNFSHMPIRYGLKCNGKSYFFDFHGKFRFRDPNVQARKGLKVAVRNISQYAMDDAKQEEKFTKVYTAWKDYDDDNYSEDFKFDKEKKGKDDHLYFQWRGVSSHTVHYIIYEGDMDKDQFRSSLEEFTVEDSNKVALAAFEKVIASGTVEMPHYSSAPNAETTFKTESETDILKNKKTTQKTEICGNAFIVKRHTPVVEEIYARGSEEGMRRCIGVRTVDVTLSSGYGMPTSDKGYPYTFSLDSYAMDDDILESYGFKRHGLAWYHPTKSSVTLPSMSRSKARSLCAKYY